MAEPLGPGESTSMCGMQLRLFSTSGELLVVYLGSFGEAGFPDTAA